MYVNMYASCIKTAGTRVQVNTYVHVDACVCPYTSRQASMHACMHTAGNCCSMSVWPVDMQTDL